MRFEPFTRWGRTPGRGRDGGDGPWAERGAALESPVLRKIWHSTRGQWKRFALLAFIAWSAYSLMLSPHGWLRLEALKRDAARRQLACEALGVSRDSLELITAELNGGEDYFLEVRAREEFGFVRPNERVYRIPDDAEDDRCIGDAATRGGERFSDRALRKR